MASVAFFAACTKIRVTPAPQPFTTVLFVAMTHVPTRWYALGSSWMAPPRSASESSSAVSSGSGAGCVAPPASSAASSAVRSRGAAPMVLGCACLLVCLRLGHR